MPTSCLIGVIGCLEGRREHDSPPHGLGLLCHDEASKDEIRLFSAVFLGL